MPKSSPDSTNNRIYEAIRLRTMPDVGVIEAYAAGLRGFLDRREWRGVYSPPGTQVHTFESVVFPGITVAVLTMPKASLVRVTGNSEASTILDPSQPVPFVLGRSTLQRRGVWTRSSAATLEHETAHVLQGLRYGPLASEPKGTPDAVVEILTRWFRQELDASFIEAYHYPDSALHWVEDDGLTEKLNLLGPFATEEIAIRRVVIWRNYIHTIERATSGLDCDCAMDEFPAELLRAVFVAMITELNILKLDVEDIRWFVTLDHWLHAKIAWDVTAGDREARTYREKMSRSIQGLIDHFSAMP